MVKRVAAVLVTIKRNSRLSLVYQDGYGQSVRSVVISLVIALFLFGSTEVTEVYAGLGFDGRFYQAMAFPEGAKPAFICHAPYCNRILSPAAAALLPVEPEFALPLLTLVSFVLLLCLAARVFTLIGMTKDQAVIGMLLLSGVFWCGRWFVLSPYYIDCHTQALHALFLVLALERRTAALVGVMVLGTLQKESFVLLSFVGGAIWYQQLRDQRKALLFTAILLAISGVTAVAVQATRNPVNSWAIEAVVINRIIINVSRLEFWCTLPLVVSAGFGVAVYVLLVWWRSAKRCALDHPWIPVWLLVAGLESMAGDTARLLSIGALPATALVLLTAKSFSPLQSILLVALQLWAGSFFSFDRMDVGYVSHYKPDQSGLPLTELYGFYAIPLLAVLIIALWARYDSETNRVDPLRSNSAPTGTS